MTATETQYIAAVKTLNAMAYAALLAILIAAIWCVSAICAIHARD